MLTASEKRTLVARINTALVVRGVPQYLELGRAYGYSLLYLMNRDGTQSETLARKGGVGPYLEGMAKMAELLR